MVNAIYQLCDSLFERYDFLSLTVDATLLGFVVFSLLFVVRTKPSIHNLFSKNMDTSATYIAIATGSIICIYHLAYVYNALSETDSIAYHRIFGRYWFAYWIYPIVYILGTQSLWSVKIRNSKTMRVIIVLSLLIVMHLEKLMTLVAFLNLHGHAGNSTFTNFILSCILDCIFKLSIFSGLFWLVHSIRNLKIYNLDNSNN